LAPSRTSDEQYERRRVKKVGRPEESGGCRKRKIKPCVGGRGVWQRRKKPDELLLLYSSSGLSLASSLSLASGLSLASSLAAVSAGQAR
jgi:hypothetical protein